MANPPPDADQQLATEGLCGLAAVMLLAALANGFDAGHALLAQAWFQLPGALPFAVVYLAAALWLFKRPTLGERG